MFWRILKCQVSRLVWLYSETLFQKQTPNEQKEVSSRLWCSCLALYINFLKIKILTLETLLLAQQAYFVSVCRTGPRHRALVLVSCLLLLGLLIGVEPITEREREDNYYLWKCQDFCLSRMTFTTKQIVTEKYIVSQKQENLFLNEKLKRWLNSLVYRVRFVI